MVEQARAVATRETLGPTLVRLAQEGLDIVVVDADLGVSTSAAIFGKTFPDRFITIGVSEQDMIGVAAGLAAAGKTVFASTFAVFAPGRCFDQIRLQVAQTGLNVKVMGSHSGVITGEDGASAQALDDVALMLSMPTFNVLVPADAVEAEQTVEVAARNDGPFYIRFGRPKIPVIYDGSYRFRLGKADLLRPGNDVAIMAVGVMVGVALEAAKLLAAEGIDCRVLNLASLRPLDKEAVLAAAAETGAIVTAEDHFPHGGLGGLIAEVLAQERPTPMAIVGVERYGTSGKWDELLQHFRLTPERLAQEAKAVMARKGG
ncbi:MAG: transketolase family protein [Dehalococcoidia bacterium]